MKLTALELAGAWLLEPEPLVDERGFFARTFCRDELARHGIEFAVAQTNLSYNRRRGTLRGLHYQAAPFEEQKVVSCAEGAIFDVIVDLRPGSPTRGRWLGVELSPMLRQSLLVPAGFAHGFQTLADDTLVSYLMSESYHPEASRGIRWDDPTLAITWPLPDPTLSPRDAAFGGFV